MFETTKARFGRLGYLLAVHEDCAGEGRYPTILYLHGAGSRGEDLDVIRNSSFFVNAIRLDAKARIYAPQCYADTWFEVFEQLIAFAEFARGEAGTDPERFSLAGVSMGGYAAWQLAMSRPELFSALTPVCGGGMSWNAARLKEIPIRAYHGELDRTVFPEESVRMVEAVNRSGGHAELTLYPAADHNAWDPTFSSPEYWQWILGQKKGR